MFLTAEEVDIYRWPQDPWVAEDITPTQWLQLNIGRFLFSDEHIINSAQPYKPGDGPNRAGVYFLLKNGRIWYVGQSDDIARRLTAHVRAGKRFTHYWCFGGVPQLWITEVEGFYIHLWEPIWNTKISYITGIAERCLEEARAGRLAWANQQAEEEG